MKSRLIILLATIFGLLPGLANGQTPEEVERFEALISQGQSHFENEDFERALVALEEAETIFEHPSLSFRILLASVASGRCQRATDRWIALSRSDLPTALVERLNVIQGDVDACISTGRLIVECSPGSATWEVDLERHSCADEVTLPSGEYVLEVSHEEYQTKERVVVVEEGSTARVYVELEPREVEELDTASTFPTRKVGVGAAIAGGGLILTGIILDAGAPGRQDEIREVALAGDGQRVLELEEKANSRKNQSLALVAVGAALTATGVALYVLSSPSEEDTKIPYTVAIIASVASLDLRVTW